MNIELGKGMIRPSRYHLIKIFPTLIDLGKEYFVGKETNNFLRLVCRRPLGNEYYVYEYEVLRNCVINLNRHEYSFGKPIIRDVSSHIIIADAYPLIEVSYRNILLFKGHGKFEGSEDYKIVFTYKQTKEEIKRRIIK